METVRCPRCQWGEPYYWVIVASRTPELRTPAGTLMQESVGGFRAEPLCKACGDKIGRVVAPDVAEQDDVVAVHPYYELTEGDVES